MITRITQINQQPRKSFKAGGAIHEYRRCSSILKALLFQASDLRLHPRSDVAIFRTSDEKLQETILKEANIEGIRGYSVEFPAGSLKNINIDLLAASKT